MFYDWLLAQCERTDRVGVIASSLTKYPNFPKSHRLYLLLRWADGRPPLRSAIKYVHAEWRKVRER